MGVLGVLGGLGGLGNEWCLVDEMGERVERLWVGMGIMGVMGMMGWGGTEGVDSVGEVDLVDAGDEGGWVLGVVFGKLEKLVDFSATEVGGLQGVRPKNGVQNAYIYGGH